MVHTIIHEEGGLWWVKLSPPDQGETDIRYLVGEKPAHYPVPATQSNGELANGAAFSPTGWHTAFID